MGQKQDYASFRFTLAAGRQKEIPIYGRWLAVLDNSIQENPHVSIEGGSFYEIPCGVSIRPPDPFTRIEFKNPTTSIMSLWVAVSAGEIYDARSVIAASSGAGQLPVVDVSNDVYTYDAIRALPYNILINAAAAVNKGGGKVGIPLTGQKFSTNESVRILGTVNYDGIYAVDATSSVNEVVITHAYVAETFDGVGDRIGPEYGRKVLASSRKELIAYNSHATVAVWWGDQGIDTRFAGPTTTKGIPIPAKTSFIITCTDDLYFMAEDAAGAAGCLVSMNALRTA
jgi:hypothetical protein